MKKEINQVILRDFDLDIDVLMRTQKRYGEMMKHLPQDLRNDASMKCDVMFLKEEVDSPESIEELPAREGVDSFRYIPGAILSVLDKKNLSKSGLMKLAGRRLYQQMTIRNINTARKIFEHMQGN